MASKLISQMGLPQSIANVFAARNIQTAKALLLMEDRLHNGYLVGHLSTRLKGVDDALCGGIPSGALTELVGPAGIGKTQFCLKLALAAALPVCNGGLNGRVIYIDTESKFSSTRMIEIGKNSYPELFRMEGKAQEMAGRIVVLRPASLSEFTESLQEIKVSVLQHQVKLLIIDSMAALVSGEYERDTRAPRKNSLGWHISFLKSLAEFSQIPIVVTNQVRAQSSDVAHYPFEVHNMDQTVKNHEHLESHLVAALGIHWAHAVNIRLVLEAHSDQRFIKVAKSPCSPPKAFPFVVTSGGISLLSDEGIEVMGPEINTIRCQGYDNLVRGERW
ncbi:DNA repair protein RAD51 homolog 2 isoform X3 [Magnolia sinica]|uniref:DNA repair protein RAD51 homolog 2 isoform X3 n=1 Tax=Magnolia sinica TaxID=86752 RepID=UPI00265A2F18|nr:DNA repair protein RAD51 homolog 2 isoform X3 [Magnolia sinica]